MQRLSGFFNNKIKQRTKTTPKGKNKQAGRQKTGAQSTWKLTWRRHMKDNGSAQDCRHKENYIGRQTRVMRETQLEPLKQWLSNKMGGDRQSTWEHMAPNKQQAMCSTDRDIWWPAWAHQQDRDNIYLGPPIHKMRPEHCVKAALQCTGNCVSIMSLSTLLDYLKKKKKLFHFFQNLHLSLYLSLLLLLACTYLNNAWDLVLWALPLYVCLFKINRFMYSPIVSRFGWKHLLND